MHGVHVCLCVHPKAINNIYVILILYNKLSKCCYFSKCNEIIILKAVALVLKCAMKETNLIRLW